MEKGLSREILKAHNATGKSTDTVSHKSFGLRDRAGTMQSESSSGTGKLKLQRLRHKIKLFGGSFSKSGSESQIQKQYENTYRLEPDEKTKFSTKKAEETIHHVLENYLKGKKYDPKKFPNLCKSLAELIKERVKTSGCQRYKLIAHVMILENQGQSMRHVSRCLWNKDHDNYATATFETSEFTAVGSVFATYYD
ncbi:dynein light chain Tctex-type protein 2B-like [Mercenaria mercenaria]|uniref:dynein light chain Tctex-type protein 2B-like n=1 Tax=Mercenaria mercenaria TaxID=6596 RepID=UPI00234FB365|nr:dynein light chain Tctex-type protein 2B-like [Mercenaria mercenaria]